MATYNLHYCCPCIRKKETVFTLIAGVRRFGSGKLKEDSFFDPFRTYLFSFMKRTDRMSLNMTSKSFLRARASQAVRVWMLKTFAQQ